MSAIIQKYNYIFRDLADPRTQDWWHFSSPLSPIIIVTLYLYAVCSWLPNYMTNKKPYSLKTVTQVHNIVQVVSCAGVIYAILTSGWNNYSLGCQPIDYSENPLALRALNAAAWAYFVKTSELMETIFFLLRKKQNQVSTLHVYHHASMIVITWAGVKYIGGGMTLFPLVLNCAIHVLMYSYYFLSTCGADMQRKLAPLKPLLTRLQIIQFLVIIVHASRSLMRDCDQTAMIFWLYVPNVTVILLFFLNFYVKSYGLKKEV